MAKTLEIKRTVREILLDLPLQKRLQFKEELRRIGNTSFQEALSNDFQDSLTSIIGGYFIWADTRQGLSYWSEICYKS